MNEPQKTKSELLNEKRVLQELRSLLPRHLEHLKTEDEPGYLGSFHIFEESEKLYEAFFSTEYSKRHLDWDFFQGVLYALICNEGIHDAAEIVSRLVTILEASKESRDWIVINPIKINPLFRIFRKQSWVGVKKFGRFNLISPAATPKELKSRLAKIYGVKDVCPISFAYQSDDGKSDSALKKLPMLTFEVHGSEESRNESAELKQSYFFSLIELYGVLNGGRRKPWPNEMGPVNHAFFIRKNGGEIDRKTLDFRCLLSADFSDDFFKYLKKHNFEDFSNHIFFRSDKIFSRIKSALYFFAKGMNTSDKVLEFVSYVIALEALFSKDKNTPIKITLAEYTALLCYPKSKRLKIHNTIRDIYDVRSGLVHTGKFRLEHSMIDESRDIAATAIYHYFKLYKKLLDAHRPIDIEKQLFDHLRDLRLGIA
ncbi:MULTISPECIES: HEPN domain-containing protein [unclassified Pseudomonas]|uniref:HEPN domain-containing protein n=1 Tax=unclassified Pseudomonas TaxID=196821 RepID=UPI000A1E4F9D|nr:MULTISPECIES: HEPN domain-containing protein [unclassified Pseudomonas]MDI2141305.1 hypothetical protein [Pseudomonas sp. ITA]